MKTKKAILQIPEDSFKKEFNNLTYDMYRIVAEIPNEIMITTKQPVGEPIILITSNMPEPLREVIDEMIKRYCNH